MSDDNVQGIDLSGAYQVPNTAPKTAVAATPKSVSTSTEGVDLSDHYQVPGKPAPTQAATGTATTDPTTPGFLQRTSDKAGAAMDKALAPNPENLKSFAKTNAIEVPKTLGREVKSGLETGYNMVKGLPGALYHAATDSPTADEAALSPEQRMLSRVGGVPQAIEAGQTYANPATRPSMGQVLENAPEALGQGAGTVLGGEAMGRMGGALKEGMQTPGFKEVTHAPIRAASRVAEHVAPAAPVLGEVVAGFPGLMAARTLKGTIADIIEKGKVSGLPKMEANATVLEGRAATAAKAAAKTQADADLYKASHVPEEVDKVNKKAQAAAQDAQFHADAARQAVEATKPAPKTVGQSVADIAGVTKPETPAAQMTAKPAAPAPAPMETPGPKPPMRAMNVKGPGEVQPETFPRTPTERPTAPAGQMEIPGGRMGMTKMLPEAPMNLPQEVLPSEKAPALAPEVKPPVTLEQGPGKLATPEPEPKAAPTVPPVKAADLERQIKEGLGNKPIEPGVKIGEQGKAAAEPEVKLSSRPDKAMLQKAKATPEEIDKILPLTRVELSKLAGHFDVDLGDKAIGREKVASGTKIPREEVLQKIVDAGHTTADIAKAIDEGKHLPTVGGGTSEADTAFEHGAIADWHNKNQGFSYNPKAGFLRDEPVFSVAGELHGPDYEKDVKGQKITDADVKEFMERPKVKEALAADPDRNVGGWNYKGDAHLELSKMFKDKDAAMAEGKRLNQDSIYDHAERKNIDTGGTAAEETKAAAEKPAYTGEERRETKRAPMNAAETEEAMKQRKPFVNPVDETHGAMDTINRDLESKGLGTPKAPKYAAPEKGIPETSLAKGPEAEKAQTATLASEKLAEGWKKDSEDIDAAKKLPTVSGGSGEGEAKAKENALPKLAEEHMTPEEKAGVSKSNVGRKNFVDNLAKAPQLQEWVDAAKAGEGAKHWYQRSGKAFDALHAEAPKYFQEGDREKWGNFVAATSPQQMVHNNLHEALHAWTQWVDDGRPMDDKGMEKSLRDSIVSVPNTKVPNAMLALQGKDMWPTLDKNQYFKVPSFGKNLNGYLNHVTNDGWQALFGGLDAKSVSSPTTYHPLSVMTRAAADALGWKPAEAQAAIWSFTQALKERGEVDPNIVRQYSEDFADIMAHNHEIRTQLKSLGVDLGKLDTRLEAIGEKPEITPGTSATTEHSTRQLAERIETARGKGAIPTAKSAQGELNFREAPAGEGRTRVPDEATEFNPEKFRTQTNEPVMEKPGKKKSPMKKMNV